MEILSLFELHYMINDYLGLNFFCAIYIHIENFVHLVMVAVPNSLVLKLFFELHFS